MTVQELSGEYGGWLPHIYARKGAPVPPTAPSLVWLVSPPRKDIDRVVAPVSECG
jgi:hypothetical protein